MDRRCPRPDPGSLEEKPGRVKLEVEFKKAPPDPGRGSAAPISGASYGNSTPLTPLLSDEERLEPARAPLIESAHRRALLARPVKWIVGIRAFGLGRKLK